MSEVAIRPWAAASSMLGAMLIIGFIDNVIPLISREIGLWQFLLVRASISVPLIACAGLLLGSRLRPLNWGAVGLRSLWVTMAMLVYFGALAVIPIQEALAGLFTSPVFVLLLTVFLYGERVGPWRVLAVIIGFGGVLVVLGPAGGGRDWASLVPALAGLFYALGALATRRSCAAESTLTMLIGVMGCQAVVAVLALAGLGAGLIPTGDGFLSRGWVWPLDGVIWLIVLQAVGSALGVGLIIRAYQLGDTTKVAIYEYSVFVFGPVFAWMLFQQGVMLQQAVGITLIAAAGILITVRSSD